MSGSLNETKEQVIHECFHCGLPCELEDIVNDDKHFCCQGCKTVFEILNENDLSDYYSLEDTPGNTLRTVADREKFAYLDNTVIQSKILKFQSENFAKVLFFIPSIHCSSCIWLLENLEQLAPGVIRSRVNFSEKEVTIDFDPEMTNLRAITELLASVG